ncbi:MAG: sialidase family protein [Acidobacteriota bacterium]
MRDFHRSLRRGLGLALAAICIATVLPAQTADQAPETPLTPSQLRAQLMPEYQKLMNDPQFHALRAQAEAEPTNRAMVDAWLRYLPMSPKELLELDMMARRYEHMVPKTIMDLHYRWMQLRPALATAHYGDEDVNQIPELLPEVKPADNATEGGPGPIVGPNKNVAFDFAPPPEDYQGEVQLAVNPLNPDQIVIGANSFDTLGGQCGDLGTQSIFYSSDGGATWGHTCSPDEAGFPALGACAESVFGSDPAVIWNDQNQVFINHMMLCGGFFTTEFSIVTSRSDDGGATWTPVGIVANSWGGTDVEDKNFYEIDLTPSSPFYGRHYVCWDRSNDQKTAYSTDGGATYVEVDLPANPGTLDLGCELEVEDDGTVHVIFNTLTCPGATCNNEQMFYTSSTDGGVSWAPLQELVDFSLVGFSNLNCPPAQDNRCINPQGTIAVDNTGGACDGNLYVTFTDFTAGNDAATTDVFVIRSTDGGTTWGAPVRVNDDAAGDAGQFHPFMVVDPANGYPVVGWQDTRNNASGEELDVYVSRSEDCGLSFVSNIQATAPSAEFNNPGISATNLNTTTNANANPNQTGEYLGVDAFNNKVYLAWTDSRHYFPASTTESQAENVGFTVIDFFSAEVFDDGFESADTSSWSATTGGGI